MDIEKIDLKALNYARNKKKVNKWVINAYIDGYKAGMSGDIGYIIDAQMRKFKGHRDDNSKTIYNLLKQIKELL